MKKTLITLTVILATLALVAVFSNPAMAKVTGRCDNCHTMHNSQGGADVYPEVYGNLLAGGCVSCHSSSDSSTTYSLGTSTVPVVNYTGGSAPHEYLAGGNFWWVADLGGDDDSKGHNVLGIAGVDDPIDETVGAPGNQYGGSCQLSGCHGTLAKVNTAVPSLGSGCQGCHLKVKHHANDRTGTKYVDNEDQGWYRFLAKHSGGDVENYGVKGIEDVDWQATTGVADHNEYLGVPVDKSEAGYTSLTNGSMTAFCCGCHGDFHTQNANVATGTGSQSPWLRHPSDFVIPSDANLEYSGMSTSYDPLSPVARPEGFAWEGDTPSGTVTTGTDMVMCLSCHRPHGSDHEDLLRWDYSVMVAGGGGMLENQGCFYCHVTKDD
jgi:hypothetical protein